MATARLCVHALKWNGRHPRPGDSCGFSAIPIFWLGIWANSLEFMLARFEQFTQA
jgi:hypothetical protein